MNNIELIQLTKKSGYAEEVYFIEPKLFYQDTQNIACLIGRIISAFKVEFDDDEVSKVRRLCGEEDKYMRFDNIGNPNEIKMIFVSQSELAVLVERLIIRTKQ